MTQMNASRSDNMSELIHAKDQGTMIADRNIKKFIRCG